MWNYELDIEELRMATCSSQGNVMNMDNMVIGGPAVYSYEDIPCANGECVVFSPPIGKLKQGAYLCCKLVPYF